MKVSAHLGCVHCLLSEVRSMLYMYVVCPLHVLAPSDPTPESPSGEVLSHAMRVKVYLTFRSTCLSVYLTKIQQGAWGLDPHGEAVPATHTCVSVPLAGRRSGSPVHRERSQGAEEVLPGSRGPREPPVLPGTHFRSQGEIDSLPGTSPLGPPHGHVGAGAAWRG